MESHQGGGDPDSLERSEKRRKEAQLAEATFEVGQPTHDDHQTTYRATRVPNYYDRKSLAAALVRALRLPKASDVKIWSFASDTSDPAQKDQIAATISFLNTPSFPAAGNKPGEWSLILQNDLASHDTIYIDSHFLGFTPLSPLENDEEHLIDCIAIHGWGGHPFGSFRANNEYMWLRDSLAREEPKLRVWIYGYESSLRSEESISDIFDYADTFRRLLGEMRKGGNKPSKSPRPLAFIVHSLGGIVFKEACINMKKSTDPADRLNLASIYGVLFFGVPNNGMVTEDLIGMVGDRPQRFNLSLLDRTIGHRLRNKQHLEFCDAFDFTDSKIIQFFETKLTPSVQCVDKDKEIFKRIGPMKLFVDPNSATCGRTWENTNDFKISIGADHSKMVKFWPNDRVDYPKVRGVLRDFSEAAFCTIEKRFAPGTSKGGQTGPKNTTGTVF